MKGKGERKSSSCAAMDGVCKLGRTSAATIANRVFFTAVYFCWAKNRALGPSYLLHGYGGRGITKQQDIVKGTMKLS